MMIFLAVSLGFIAENIRESISNHELEKHYVESLINNLNEDTAYMNMAIKENKDKADSLEKLVHLAHADFSKTENLAKCITILRIELAIMHYLKEMMQR